MPTTENPCESAEKLSQTRAECLYNCSFHAMSEKCTCMPIDSEAAHVNTDQTWCTPDELYKCAGNYFEKDVRKMQANVETCAGTCPFSCEVQEVSATYFFFDVRIATVCLRFCLDRAEQQRNENILYKNRK